MVLCKVSEIRLFGEEDIQQELFLSICEWPSLPDRLVVHGYRSVLSVLVLFVYQKVGSIRSIKPVRAFMIGEIVLMIIKC